MRRTTVAIDEELLARAKHALGAKTNRATVEQALQRVAAVADGDHARRGAKQQDFLDRLGQRADLRVLAGDKMWR